MRPELVAWLALAVAGLALVGIVVHALIPTPPAHVADPFRVGLPSGERRT